MSAQNSVWTYTNHTIKTKRLIKRPLAHSVKQSRKISLFLIINLCPRWSYKQFWIIFHLHCHFSSGRRNSSNTHSLFRIQKFLLDGDSLCWSCDQMVGGFLDDGKVVALWESHSGAGRSDLHGWVTSKLSTCMVDLPSSLSALYLVRSLPRGADPKSDCFGGSRGELVAKTLGGNFSEQTIPPGKHKNLLEFTIYFLYLALFIHTYTSFTLCLRGGLRIVQTVYRPAKFQGPPSQYILNIRQKEKINTADGNMDEQHCFLLISLLCLLMFRDTVAVVSYMYYHNVLLS